MGTSFLNWFHVGSSPTGDTIDIYAHMSTKNSAKLISLLKQRLSSNGKAKSIDTFGNTIYVDCNIYSAEMLECFIELSLSNFNQFPVFTSFTLDDDKFVETFTEILVEGATLYALSSQALIERGREFVVTDNGMHYVTPSVSELLQTQYSVLLGHHFNKLQIIKSAIRDFPT